MIVQKHSRCVFKSSWWLSVLLLDGVLVMPFSRDFTWPKFFSQGLLITHPLVRNCRSTGIPQGPQRRSRATGNQGALVFLRLSPLQVVWYNLIIRFVLLPTLTSFRCFSPSIRQEIPSFLPPFSTRRRFFMRAGRGEGTSLKFLARLVSWNRALSTDLRISAVSIQILWNRESILFLPSSVKPL